MRTRANQVKSQSNTDAYRVSKTTFTSRESSRNHQTNTARVVESLVNESSAREQRGAARLPTKSASMDLRFVKPGIPITYSMGEGPANLRQSNTGAFSDLQALMQAEMSVSAKPEEIGPSTGGVYAQDRLSLSSDVQLPRLGSRQQLPTLPGGSFADNGVEGMANTWRSKNGGDKTARGPGVGDQGSFLKKQTELHRRKKTWQGSDYLGLRDDQNQVGTESELKHVLRSAFPQRGVGKGGLSREHPAR